MRGLLSNVEFRKALALAINQDELINNVLDGGAGIRASAGLVDSSLEDFTTRKRIACPAVRKNVLL